MKKNILYSFFHRLFGHKTPTIPDPYNDFADPENHTWIYREHEIHEQLPPTLFRTSHEYHLQIGEILNNLFSVFPDEVSDLIINNGIETSIINDPSLIWNFDILTPYLNTKADTGFEDKHVFYSIAYRKKEHRPLYLDKSTLNTDGAIMIHCHPAGSFKDSTAYLHVTICLPTSEKIHMSNHQSDQGNNYQTLTVAHDFKRPSQALAEYNYMRESVDNYCDLKQSTLTENEWALLEHIQPQIGNEFYWGKKAFNSNRYLDAILYFKNVYNVLRDTWYKKGLNSKEMTLLTECSYLIGYAYNDLKLYDRAYHYLELAGRSNNKSYKYKKEFVNCLVNSRNLLSIIYIDDYLQELKNLPENKRNEEDLKFFYFLLRRKAYILIEMDQFDDAEYILQRLLEKDPDNLIILKELAYIQHQRKQRQNVTQERAEKK